MAIHKLLVALMFLVPTAALAKKGPKTPRVPSSEERKDKSYTFDAQPLTLFVGSVGEGFTQGASVGTFMTPDLIARVTARGGKSCLYERCTYIENSAGASLQLFVANSLFVEGGGMVQRTFLHPTSDADSYEYQSDKGFTYTADTAGGTFALGNQWQWGAFTLGVRWFSVYQAMFSRGGKVHADKEGRTVGRDQKDRLQQLEREFKLYLPSLALGFSF